MNQNNSVPARHRQLFRRGGLPLALALCLGPLACPVQAQFNNRNSVLSAILNDNSTVGYGVENMFYVGPTWGAYYESWCPYGRASQTFSGDVLYFYTSGRARVQWSIGTTATQGSYLTVSTDGTERTRASGYSGWIGGYADFDGGSHQTYISFNYYGGSDVGVISRLWVDTQPNFYQSPSDAYALSGNSVSMTAKAYSGTMTYEWYDRYNTYLGSGSTVYFTANATREGQIRCKAYNNTLGATYYTDTYAYLYLIQTPVMTSQPTSVVAAPGTTVTFYANANNYQLNYQWYKSNGSAISGANSYYLYLYNVQAADEGGYYCRIWNGAGSVQSSTATLTMAIPPVITVQPVSITRNPGSSATFSVTATGTSPSYEWYKNSNFISGATSSSYTIPNVVLADAGNFQVKVWNVAGTVWSSNAVLSTIIPPTITVQPASLITTQGLAATFWVTVTGSPSVYQWLKGGPGTQAMVAENFNAGNGGFTVTSPQAFAGPWQYDASAGTWRADGQSPHNSQTNATLLSSPAFTVTNSGTARLSFTHRYNFEPGYDAGQVRMSLNGGAYATVPVSAFTTNGYNGSVSAGALSALAGQSAFTNQSAGYSNGFITTVAELGTVSQNDTISLQFIASADASQAPSGNSALANALDTSGIAWTNWGDALWGAQTTNTHDGVDAGAAGVIASSQQSVLETTITGPANLGFWWKVSSESGWDWLSFSVDGSLSNRISGEVDWQQQTFAIPAGTHRLTWTYSTDSSVLGGQNLAWVDQVTGIDVAADTNAPATNHWEIDQVALDLRWEGGVPIAGANGTNYTIASAQPADADFYSVLVTNLAGRATSSLASLTVRVPPAITTQPVAALLPVGAGTNLSVVATGTTPLAYQWQYKNVSVAGATSSSLTLANLTLAQSGPYRVIVSNVAGAVTSAPAVVTVMSLPSIVTAPTSVFTNLGSTVVLRVTAATAGAAVYQWYFRENPIPYGTNASLILPNAQVSQVGWYRVRVSNPVGLVYSPRVWVMLGPVENRGVAWGDSSSGQTLLATDWTNLVALSAGDNHSLGLRGDGSVLAVGANDFQQASVPAGLSRVVGIAAGSSHSVALRENGRVMAWGNNAFGLTNVPSSWSNLVAVAAGASHTAALFADGTPTVHNQNMDAPDFSWDIDAIPMAALPGVAIAAAAQYTAVLRADGQVVVWGANLNGLDSPPAEATNLTAVAAGPSHLVALRADGRVIAWGDDTYGQATVPENVTNAVGVAAGGFHSQAILADGTLVAWGAGASNKMDEWPHAAQSTVPAEVTDATTMAAGVFFGLAGVPAPPRFLEPLASRVGYTLGQTITLETRAAGCLPLGYQWFKDGVLVAGATSSTLALTNLGPYAGAAYTVTVSNLVGLITSGTLTLERDTPYVPVAITQQPQSAATLRASPVVLSVVAQGTAPLRYQWVKNGTPLDGATNDYHRAATAQLSDTAAYSVVVSNDWEVQVSDTAQVDVMDPPSWPETYTNRSLLAGQTLTITVDNTGSGPFDYEWYHNGQPIEGVTSNTLVITNLTWQNEGEYSVKISNPVGTITRTFLNLHVVSPPYLLRDLADVASPRGTNAELFVWAGGEPPLGYVWYQDGVLMPDEFHTNLFIYDVAYAHTNQAWQIVVTNSMGAITSRVAHLTIIEPPVILTQPVSVVAEPNTEARFSVTCGGTLPLTYQWYRNGAPVSGGSDPTLVIASVTSGKQGQYEVEVVNPAGVVRSEAASLAASVAPVALGVSVGRTNVAPGSNFELTARVAGLGPFSFQWLFNGVPIEGQTNLVLVISNAPPEAAGWYTFTVGNAYGNSTLDAGAGTEVRVVDLPYIESGPDDVLAILGRPATFSVVVRGTNLLSYQWLKESEPISGATAASYTIAAPKASDVGMYSVAVANAEGTTWSSLASLTFAKLPLITRQPTDEVVQPGGTATFSVAVQSQFPVTYQWRQDGGDLPGQTNPVLSVTVPLRVVGWDHSYSVVVSSEVGRVSSMSATLALQRTPEILLKHSRLVTQSLLLIPGWNAIYLNVQPVSNRVEQIFADVPWTSVWMWRDRKNPVQFIEQMTEAAWNEPDWLVCFQTNRTESFQNNLFRLYVNQAYLVHVDGTNEVWVDIEGEPALDVKQWRADSYNLTGLPIEPGREPAAADYFRHSPAHFDTVTGQIKPIYQLAADGHWQQLSNSNLLAPSTAYWFYVRGGSSYAGPVEVDLSYGRGLLFTKDVNQLRMTFLNHAATARRVWLAAHPLYAGGFPLMVREVTDQGVSFIEMPSAYPVDVPANGKTELILGADRLRTKPEGFESVMIVGDDQGLFQQLPVLVEHLSAVAEAGGRIQPNVTGLWVGQATVDGVSEVNSVTVITNRLRFTNDLGQVTNIISLSYTNTPDPTPTPVASGISQRILLHVDTNQLTRLLSEVFQLYREAVTTNDVDGYQMTSRAGQPVLVTDRRRLADFGGARLRDNAMVGRRISSPTFAFEGAAATNNYIECVGQFGPGGTVTVTFGMTADHPLNPFKHKYHPDHDNLGADFRTYQEEAYGIIREVTLLFDAGTGGASPAAGYTELKGQYREKVRGLHRNPIYVSGRFVLRRFSPIGELNPAN